MSEKADGLILLSGGVDSVTLLAMAAAAGLKPVGLFVDYGQPARRQEEAAARKAAARYGCGLVMRGLAVPGGVPKVKKGESWVVPGRNALFLSLALSLAIADELPGVMIGSVGGDELRYTDSGAEFIQSFQAVVAAASGGRVRLEAPFLHLEKIDVLQTARALSVPLAETWSCYRGGASACATCGACLWRQEWEVKTGA